MACNFQAIFFMLKMKLDNKKIVSKIYIKH